jgi:hypothetical protein
MAAVNGIVGDRDQMKLLALSALSAQLAKLPNGTPLGTSVVLIGEAGRGKNAVTDASVHGMPDGWILSFESSSAKALNYLADKDPNLLKHTFIYPNEAEATDMLVEILRPLLSGGKAVHQTVNKNSDGTNEAQAMTIEGPCTVTIPTVRNKLDSQLFSRLLVAELKDYPGRVERHSAKFTDQLTGEFQDEDHQATISAWEEAFGSLVRYRRVIVPVGGEHFNFSSDHVSHGARVWKNLLSLMLTHAWLEQNHREIRTLKDGTEAVVANADDYAVAYKLFSSVCDRTVVNLSEAHVRILEAIHELTEDRRTAFKEVSPYDAPRGGFTYRQIREKVLSKGGSISMSTISAHKTFLISSAKLLREVKEPYDSDSRVVPGLALGFGVEPEDWKTGDITEGLPRPEVVRQLFSGETPPEGPETAEQAEHPSANSSNPHRYAEKCVRPQTEQVPNTGNGQRTVQSGKSLLDGLNRGLSDPEELPDRSPLWDDEESEDYHDIF